MQVGEQGYNIGQMVLRCDQEVLEFFERVEDGLEVVGWDEQVVNELLRDGPLPRTNLSHLFTDTLSWAALDDESRMAAFSYQATETFPTEHTTSLQEKQKRFDEVLAWRDKRGRKGSD